MSEPRNLGEIVHVSGVDWPAYLDLRDMRNTRALTSHELDRLISAVALGLLERGLRPGDRIGILAENRVEFIASYFGIMRMGGVAVPINHRLPAPTITHIFRDSDIRLAFVDAARASLLPPGMRAIDFDASGPHDFHGLVQQGLDRASRAARVPEAFVPGERDLAEILYTSASTGPPKGVPLTHRGQLWAIGKYRKGGDTQAAASALVVAPLYHMNGLFFTTVALANRTRVISLPRFDARTYLETAARYRCATLSGIPTMFALMVRERDLVERLDFDSVCEVFIGSAPLTGALLGKVQLLFPGAMIRNGFGTTEAGPAVFGPHPRGRARPALSLGYPMDGVEWRLIDGPSADEGVLMLRTPALMDGYLNLPGVTAERMNDGWYITGDVMRRDADGFFFFIGRADDMFVCGGENIYPGEVEQLLERNPVVAQAVVVPAPDDIKGHIPVAFIVPQRGTQPSVEEIKQYALARGPAHAHPRIVVFREQLPVAGTHKIDRASLVAEAADLARAAGRVRETV